MSPRLSQKPLSQSYRELACPDKGHDVEYFIAILVAPVALVTGFFVVEIAAGMRREPSGSGVAPSLLGRAVVVVPAHDEERIISETLIRLAAETQGVAEILLVADNCSDGTASVARERGVEVIERHDEAHRGKGFALAFAQQHLSRDPPAVVVVIDADCAIDKASLLALAAAAERHGRPCQAVNLLRPKTGASAFVAISGFAFLLKNLVRQRGLQRLAGSVHLTGTGMAFPWDLFEHRRLANSSIVEDVKLGLELTNAGTGPMLAPDATVWSDPSSSSGTLAQRKRWEGGYIALALQTAPQALGAALRRGDLRAICRALDLCVPPIALLVMLNLVVLGVAVGLALATSGGWGAIILQSAILAAAGAAVLAAWWREGRGFVSLRTLALIPFYIVWKLPLYIGLRLRGQGNWLRTGR